jgi:hypothetical protein
MLSYNSSELTLDGALQNFWEVEKYGKRRSQKSIMTSISVSIDIRNKLHPAGSLVISSHAAISKLNDSIGDE